MSAGEGQRGKALTTGMSARLFGDFVGCVHCFVGLPEVLEYADGPGLQISVAGWS